MTIGTTSRFGLTTWSSGDDPFGRAQFQQDNLQTEELASIFRSGVLAGRPQASGAAYQKTFWYSTDTGVLEYNTGSAWSPIDQKAEAGDVVTLVPGTPSTPQGISPKLARADHSHPVSVATATTITNTNSAGSAATLARSDHNHLIGQGVVTNDNLTGSIAYSKLTLTGLVVNADISTGAAIAYSKLSITGSVVNADISSSAAIAYSKLSLGGSVVNADISSSAAISRTKLSTDVVATAGSLTFSTASGMSINVDNATVEVSSNSLRVKPASIGKAQLSSDVIQASTGLSFSNGSGISVTPNPNSAGTGTATITVGASGISVNGGISFTSAGAPSAALNDGNLSVDTTNNLLYFRSGGSWRNALWAAGTAGSGAPSARGVWIGAGTNPTNQGAVGDIWITY